MVVWFLSIANVDDVSVKYFEQIEIIKSNPGYRKQYYFQYFFVLENMSCYDVQLDYGGELQRV